MMIYIHQRSLALFHLRLCKTVSKLSCTSLMLKVMWCRGHILHLRPMSQLVVAATFTRLRSILLLGVVALSEILIKQFPLFDEAAPLKHYFGQNWMLISVYLQICDFSEPIECPLLQPSRVVVISDLIEFVCLWLHRPSLVKLVDHLVEVLAFDHVLDLLDSFFMPHTLAQGLNGMVFEGLPHLEELLIVVLHL